MVKRPDQGGCAVSVELLNTPRFYGFRVRRQIDGRTYQEYFSLKAEGKRIRGPERAEIKVRAQARDQELMRLQQKTRRGWRGAERWMKRGGSGACFSA